MVTQLLPTERAQQPPPHFLAHVCCGQMTGWIRIPLATDLGLGPADIVLDNDPVPPMKMGTVAVPTFRPMSIVTKRSPISATAALLQTFSVGIFGPLVSKMLWCLVVDKICQPWRVVSGAVSPVTCPATESA